MTNHTFRRLALASVATLAVMAIAHPVFAQDAGQQPAASKAEEVTDPPAAPVVAPPKGAVIKQQNSHAVLYDYKIEFDSAGNILEERDHPSYMEAKMLGGIEAHCTRKTHEIEGYWMEQIKTAGRSITWETLFTVAGAIIGIPHAPIRAYAGLGAGAGAANGLIMHGTIWDQNLRILYSECVKSQKGLQDRLRRVIPLTVISGNGVRKASESSDGRPYVPTAKESDTNGYIDPPVIVAH
jgi:hypothetical protein